LFLKKQTNMPTESPFPAVIVDDEPQCISLLENLVAEYCPQLRISGSARNIPQAEELIRSTSPALVFLDVEMPGESGFQLLKKFPADQFLVIFTTAYDQYAINAIRASAVDYLLKPISIVELKEAVAKAVAQISAAAPFPVTPPKRTKITLPTQDGLQFLKLDDILYCEGSSNYTFFWTRSGSKILVSRTLREYEDQLAGQEFFRIHQSYLVNLNFVRRYVRGRGGYVVMENNAELTVSARKRDQFLALTGLF
jgi:two-component system, LytTR family, response regulator